MILEVGIDELINIYQGIRFCLNMGSPIKRPLIKTEEQIKELLEKYNSSKNEIADKYLIKDEKGSPIQKDSSKAPEFMTDYMSNDEEEMVNIYVQPVNNIRTSYIYKPIPLKTRGEMRSTPPKLSKIWSA